MLVVTQRPDGRLSPSPSASGAGGESFPRRDATADLAGWRARRHVLNDIPLRLPPGSMELLERRARPGKGAIMAGGRTASAGDADTAVGALCPSTWTFVAGSPAPVALALVIDKSGSMSGTK